MQSTGLVLRWQRVKIEGGARPRLRLGHTCNAIEGGRRIYVIAGRGEDQSNTNGVYVLHTDEMTWIEPVVNGIPPSPRNGHSCTGIGDQLFVFGGVNGNERFNDLHVLDTSSNTWIAPSVVGVPPAPRAGHSAVFVGKKLIVFGGVGMDNEEYDDLYMLDTEPDCWMWDRLSPTGTFPSNRNSHTCLVWQNNIIVVGDIVSSNMSQSDVRVLDLDALEWSNPFGTTLIGDLVSPPSGRTLFGKFDEQVSLSTESLFGGQVVSPTGRTLFGKFGEQVPPPTVRTLYAFGGFPEDQRLSNVLHFLKFTNNAWIKVPVIGEGPPHTYCPPSTYSMGDESFERGPPGTYIMGGDSFQSGVLVFNGLCGVNTFDYVYCLHPDQGNVVVTMNKNVVNGVLMFGEDDAVMLMNPEYGQYRQLAFFFTANKPFSITYADNNETHSVRFQMTERTGEFDLVGFEWNFPSYTFIRRTDGSVYFWPNIPTMFF